MSSHPKIRVALIGLNAPHEGLATGTSWAATAHLPYLTATDKFELVALQNSSIERAQKAIHAYGLDPSLVRAYGSAEDLAKDSGVDLVVSCIRVDRHAASVEPSIKAGKDVFVEWPLEANLDKAHQLADLAKAYNVRTVSGYQGRFTPLALKLESLIAEGQIGMLASSSFLALAPGGGTMPRAVDYFVDKEVGGNPFTIHFAHSLEPIVCVLGKITTFKSHLVNRHPKVDIVEPGSGQVLEAERPSDVPTHVAMIASTESGALLTYQLRPGVVQVARSELQTDRPPAIDWRIFGSNGEIRVRSWDTSINTWSLNADKPELKVEIYREGVGEFVELDTVADEFSTLPLPARNIARVYEAYSAARAGDESAWYPDFEYALERHKMLESMYQESGM